MYFEVWIVKIHPYISRILQISFTQMFDSCFDNCTVILQKKLLLGKSWTLTIAQFQRPHVNYRNHFVFRKFLGRYTTSNQHIFRDFLTTNICEKGDTCRDSRLHSFWNISVIIFYVIWWTGFRNWGRNAKENSPCFNCRLKTTFQITNKGFSFEFFNTMQGILLMVFKISHYVLSRFA